ncbi:MAG: hypothetical protein DI623_12335 [Sphingomonas sanxanigenens]|uniref:Uncharacterized protein n=1 Tax=Sphingomonas sanxanigenens TaxID=397260 RepID=A0A2W5A5Y8_9SPHN|nr:MAG: hypothetical protein DI623_12335 [Sphingomonas sanxanigenens]
MVVLLAAPPGRRRHRARLGKEEGQLSHDDQLQFHPDRRPHPRHLYRVRQQQGDLGPARRAVEDPADRRAPGDGHRGAECADARRQRRPGRPGIRPRLAARAHGRRAEGGQRSHRSLGDRRQRGRRRRGCDEDDHAQAPIWDDLRSFDGRAWRGRVHLVAAGYPCQPFSYAGNRAGADDPRHLWPEVARIVEEVDPEWVWCENVEGHLSLGYAQVAADLRRMGFTPKAGLFTAREAGASHRRRRLFILAHADRLRRGICARPADRGRLDPAVVADRHSGGQPGPIFADERGEDVDSALAGAARAGLVGAIGDIPIYAPGPAELQEWERLLACRPDLQPALPRDGDGVADRLDRTRGAGNGVSSLAAALAWAVLKTAHQFPGGGLTDGE